MGTAAMAGDSAFDFCRMRVLLPDKSVFRRRSVKRYSCHIQRNIIYCRFRSDFLKRTERSAQKNYRCNPRGSRATASLFWLILFTVGKESD